ncbi:MAG: SdrD B-like domain-containing protein, partial [Saprospiraceae bacterium]
MRSQISSTFKLLKFCAILIVLLLASNHIHAQITGTVFRDYNGDGIRQSGEPLRGDIIVKFYTNGVLPVKDVLLGTTTTATNGTYSFNPGSYPVRIEFEIPDGFCNLSPTLDFSAGNGNTYGTAVQFAQGPGVHNFILTYPADFALTDNPPTYTTCFVNGDPLVPGSASGSDAFVGMNYLDNGHGANSGYYPTNPNGGPMGPPHTVLGTAAQVGSVWGVAISKQARKIFTSSMLKRHAGFGPLGGGGIYMIDPDDFSTSYNYNWLDFDTDLNIPTSNEAGVYTNALIASNQVQFSPVIGTNTERGMTGNKLDPSQDAAAWEQVGKVSFGDLDISEDGRWLYTINLYDRKLYQIDLVDPFNPTAPVLADVGTKVKGFTIPDPCSGNAGEHMPFAVKVTRGKVFVGLVCNGQALNGTTIGTANDLTGHIYEFDVVTETFNLTPVLSFPLNYRSGTANPWLPWTNVFQGYFEGAGYPMITDIEFDGKGNMIIGMVDRRGHQAGWYNYDLNGTGNYHIAVVGDLLQGVRDPNSASCSYSIQFTPEFYKDDKFHPEPVNGGLAVHRTSTVDNTIVTFMDPVWIWSGGTMRFDNLTGNKIGDGYEIYFNPGGGDVGTFGKAAGIGDIETLGEVPLIEIGNVIWSDVDRDGIQDPNEPVLSGIIVELVNANGIVVGTSISDSEGGYYFNYTNTNDPDGNGTLGPQPYTDYTIRISSTQYNNFGVNGSPLEGFVLTSQNQSGVGLSDYSDNDATNTAGIATIAITTDGPAENNHTFDFGFYPTTFDVSLSKTTSLTLPVAFGDDVPFTITVTNQGTDIVNSISVTDYIPSGYIFNAGDNPNWTGSFPNVNYTASVLNGLLTAPGISVGASIDIPLILEVAGTANANNIDNFAEITGGTDVVGNDASDDIDSTPDSNPNNDAGGQIRSDADNYIDGDGSGTPGDGVDVTDEDDHDGETVRFIDVALVKDISITSPPPYSYGSPVTYIITVTNQSNEAIYNIDIEDNLPSGFSFTPNNGWTESIPGILSYTIFGPMIPGSTTFVELILTPIQSNQPNAWINQAQITGLEDENGDPIGDGDVDSDPGNGPSGGSEDDDDQARIDIFDLALRKTLVTLPPYTYGQTMTFAVEVFN